MANVVGACLVCGSHQLEQSLSLGLMPPVNSFLSGPEDIAKEKGFPLALAFCAGCSHVQLTHMLDPKDVFEHYIYFSSMSSTIVQYGKDLAARYAAEINLQKGDLVAELASNDGCILKPFAGHCRIHGVEPAKNIAEVAEKEGVPTTAEFFDSKLGESLRGNVGPARLIMARNVLAHVPKVVDFVQGVTKWLTDDGIFHVEVPYVRNMFEHLEFDTIYHEHLSYFSVTVLDRLFREAGLVLWDVELIALHGGSLVARGKKAGATPKPSVKKFIEEEAALGYRTIEPLRQFARGTERLKTGIPDFLLAKKKEGRTMAGYGAAAKGVVLTNYCNIGTDFFPFVADRSPHKQGKLMPGKHMPVVSPDRILQDKPDLLVVLAWNFFEEIAAQLAPYHKAGGKFVVPVPAPVIREPRS